MRIVPIQYDEHMRGNRVCVRRIGNNKVVVARDLSSRARHPA